MPWHFLQFYLLPMCSNLSLDNKVSSAELLEVPTPKPLICKFQLQNVSGLQVFQPINWSQWKPSSWYMDTFNKSFLHFSYLKMLLKFYRLGRKSHKLVSPLWGFRKISRHSQAWFTMMNAEILFPPQKVNMHTKPVWQVGVYTVLLPWGRNLEAQTLRHLPA